VLTMVLSLASAKEDLESGRASQQLRALDDLASLGPRGGAISVSLLCAHLGDASPDVRRAAQRAFSRTAGRGDECAVAAAVPGLAARSWRARLGSVLALEFVAVQRDAMVLEVLEGALEDDSCHVRRAAVQALASLAAPSDRVVCLLAARLEDTTCWVRAAAVKAVTAVAEWGDPHVVALLGARLAEDKDRETRRVAMQALAEVAMPGDQCTLALLARQLEDEGVVVRRSAVEAIAALAEPGDGHVAGLLSARLRDDSPKVRMAAAAGLQALTS